MSLHFIIACLDCENVRMEQAFQEVRTIELSVKCVQKRELRENFIKTRISTSQGVKSSLVVVWQQV
jgi:elongation factor P--beta-lysine ligase